MKFNDLKDFIENSMILVENYQPIVIAALVQNGGSATRKELKIQLQKANPERDLDHFSQCPAFDIITRSVERVGNVLYNGDKIAELRDNDTFRMLDFDSYTNTQKAWILVECALKDKEKREFLEQYVKRTKEEIETTPQLTTDKKQVLKDYSSEFFTKKFTRQKLLEFCDFNNNHHWKDISRPAGKIDEKKLVKLNNIATATIPFIPNKCNSTIKYSFWLVRLLIDIIFLKTKMKFKSDKLKSRLLSNTFNHSKVYNQEGVIDNINKYFENDIISLRLQCLRTADRRAKLLSRPLVNWDIITMSALNIQLELIKENQNNK